MVECRLSTPIIIGEVLLAFYRAGFEFAITLFQYS